MNTAAVDVWDQPTTVASFARSAPNPHLMHYARLQRCPWASTRVLDIGCGAGRNAIPLAEHGFQVIGIDQSRPMLDAAAARNRGCLTLAAGTMTSLPIRDESIELIVAHGIWNLARSDHELRASLLEAARVAAPGCALFVFTFSRLTLRPDATPLPGQTLVFDQFSGSPQVFLTRQQLHDELGTAGFDPDPDLPITELNVPPPGQTRIGGAPVIFQGGFRRRGV